MTPTRRIFLNIIATYGRSLYALVIGLFCGRWTLMALGEVDYGLLGVVGGLTAFIAFFFGILSGAVGRFYGIAIGRSRVEASPERGLGACREWFSLAVTIHLFVPCVLLIVGYPLGVWAVKHYLVVPPERISACVWVFRFVCISSLLGMVSVPFTAMYQAKQYIAELTVYSFITTTLNAGFLYFMVTHSGDWLTRYAFWTCLLSVVPNVIIACRACFIFPECRFRMSSAWNWEKYRQMLAYTGWNTFGSLGSLLRVQGIAILVNRFFGPAVNASMTIANSVSGQTQTLAGSLQGAFNPVITAAVGAGDLKTVRMLALRFCKFSLILSLVFMLPLALELPMVLRLWLKTPPDYALGLCWIMLLMAFVDNNTLGHGVAIMAYGKIMWYQIILGAFNLLAIPCAWLFVLLGGTVYSVGWALLITWSLLAYGRLFFARSILQVSIRAWATQVILPVLLAILLSVSAGFVPRFVLEENFLRVCLTTLAVEGLLLPLIWFVVLDPEEREFVRVRVRRVVCRGSA